MIPDQWLFDSWIGPHRSRRARCQEGIAGSGAGFGGRLMALAPRVAVVDAAVPGLPGCCRGPSRGSGADRTSALGLRSRSRPSPRFRSVSARRSSGGPRRLQEARTTTRIDLIDRWDWKLRCRAVAKSTGRWSPGQSSAACITSTGELPDPNSTFAPYTVYSTGEAHGFLTTYPVLEPLGGRRPSCCHSVMRSGMNHDSMIRAPSNRSIRISSKETARPEGGTAPEGIVNGPV